MTIEGLDESELSMKSNRNNRVTDDDVAKKVETREQTTTRPARLAITLDLPVS